jgi:catechol 2,3-dioxygenase-like lactoylglutathione lyase family enzyme
MRKLQSQGVHHITLVGTDRQTSIDFWEGMLGMPFVFEQPNLDRPSESHLYFDPGDGRLITIFTNEKRTPDPERTPTDPGCVHHIAFSLSQATFRQAVERLDEREIPHSGVKDRGFMDSIYFEDPLGLLIELASYRFQPPHGYTHAEVLLEAHKIRTAREDYNIDQVHLADAIETLVTRSRKSLSDQRTDRQNAPTGLQRHPRNRRPSDALPDPRRLPLIPGRHPSLASRTDWTSVALWIRAPRQRSEARVRRRWPAGGRDVETAPPGRLLSCRPSGSVRAGRRASSLPSSGRSS